MKALTALYTFSPWLQQEFNGVFMCVTQKGEPQFTDISNMPSGFHWIHKIIFLVGMEGLQ